MKFIFFFDFFLVEIWFKNDISIKNMSCLTLNPTSVNNHNAHMHAISTQLVYHQCLMCIFDVNTSTPLKIEKLQGTFNAVQTSKCMFPPFLQHAPKDRKVGAGI